MSGSVSFNRTWSEYESGFGDYEENFWLGEVLMQSFDSVISVVPNLWETFPEGIFNICAYFGGNESSISVSGKHRSLVL